MKHTYLSWAEVQGQYLEIIRQVQKSDWKPDYVVGITRGGLIPAVLISQYLDVPMNTLKVSLRDDEDTESNLWMAEHAFGYIEQKLTPGAGKCMGPWHDPALQKNILIVDDINDSGATINWIIDDWQSGCMPGDAAWEKVWGHNVRFATLYDNETSKANVSVSYAAKTVNKVTDPQWIIFPWETWWMTK